MGFLEQHRLAIYDADVPAETPEARDFRKRVQLAVVKVAVLVAGESKGSLTNLQWQKRAALARNVLGIVSSESGTHQAGSLAWLDAFSLAVVQNAAITGASSDADIEFTVTSVWDDLAGVNGHDLNLMG